MTCLEQHHLATGSAIGENELMDNAFKEAPLPSHHRRSAVALAPEQRSPPSAGFYASIYIYIYIYEHEAIQKPKSENNTGVYEISILHLSGCFRLWQWRCVCLLI